MDTAAILSNPAVSSMAPVDVFHLLQKLQKTQAVLQVKKSITARQGRPMLGCFADLLDVDARIDSAGDTHVA